MRALLAILLITLGLLLMKMWLGEGGLRDVKRLEQRVQEQALENELLKQRNEQLQADVEDLRQGMAAVEERARSELGMIKESEEFYQVVPGKKAEPNDSNQQ